MKIVSIIITFALFTNLISAGNKGYEIDWQMKYDKHEDAIAYDVVQTNDGDYIICGETSTYHGKLLIIKTDKHGNEKWIKTYGKRDNSCAYSIKQTIDNGYIVAGWIQIRNEHYSDIWVIKTDNNGNIIWNKTYGGYESECGYTILQTNDMHYVLCGKKNGRLCVVKLDNNGAKLWEKTYRGTITEDYGQKITQTSDGGFAICGVRDYNTGLFSIHGKLLIIKLNSKGDIQWEKTFNENGYRQATSIYQTIDGGYAICGNEGFGDWIIIKLDYKGNLLWEKSFTGYKEIFLGRKNHTNDKAKSILQMNNESLVICGDQGSKEWPEGSDYWIINLDINGEIEWEEIFGENYYGQSATKIIQSNDGGFVICGYAEIDGRSTNNITLLKFENPEFTSIRKELEKKMDTEIAELSSFFIPNDEFETEEEYKKRIEKGNKEKNDIIKKYDIKTENAREEIFKNYKNNIFTMNQEIDYQIRLSIEEITMRIEKLGEYNAENETFPITIDGFTENVYIPRTEARSFKKNYKDALVTGYKRFFRDLETYENYNLIILHQITGNQFAFGEQKSLYNIPDRSLITITTEQGNIREKPSTNSSIIKKSSKGETFPVISFNNQWYNIKIADNINGFVHQSICSEKQVQTSDISIKPPSLKLSAELNEPSGNGFLDGEEKGEIVVQIMNSGKGPAFGVIVDIKNSAVNPNLTYSRTRVPGEIAPGEKKEVSFDIEANENISRATQTFTISALESNGFSPDPIILSFETHPIVLPDISLIDYGVITASGDSEIIPGETANITLRFQNIEQGKAEDIVFKLNLPNNVYFNPESKQEYSLDILPSGEYQDLEFSILTSNEVDDQIELSISMIEKHTTKKYPLTIEINKPLRSLREFVQKGIENETTPIIIASDLTVDISNNIPKSQKTNSDAIAVVIGNRNYLKAKNVDYAINDAILMKEYLINSFGYKDGNIFYLKNASKGEFELFFGTKDNFKGKLFNAIKENTSDVFIFYSGHGAPSLKNNKGYFVPVECDPNYVELGGYSLVTFYDNLAKIPTKSLTIVIDACFSGADIFENISPIITKTSNPIISLNNGIVFSSSKDSEVSSWYNEKKHGMFTYFFLKSIHNKNADINNDNKLTANEIIKFISNNSEGVPYYTRRIHGLEQHPQLLGKNIERAVINYD
ncbi:hypothetical protein D4R71_01055 [bacterium]|nr:MAG: hypothetical protein D4R71_01055 [bacterium]